MEKISVPTFKLDETKKKFNRVLKKANKIGATLTYEVGDVWYNEVRLPNNAKVVVEMTDIKYDFEEFRLSGNYTFYGVVRTSDGVRTLNSVPGKEIPTEFQTAESYCDHCGRRRQLQRFIVLQNAEGEFLRVGSTCIKDFLGINPRTFVTYLDLQDSCKDEYDEMALPREAYAVPLQEFLNLTSYLIRTYGFLPRSRADIELGQVATGDLGFSHLMKNEKEPPITEEDKKLAEDTISHFRESEDTSNYVFNIKQIFASERVRYADVGYAASAVASYQRHTDKLKATAVRSNEFLGEVKKRDVFEVKLLNRRATDSRFGVSILYNLEDRAGNSLVWFSSKVSDMMEYATDFIQVKGTVKKHDTFNGRNQTVLTRVEAA